MAERPRSDRTRVRREPERGAYDRATIEAILDEGLVCHLGFVCDGQPYVIPTLYGRAGDEVYVHGSSASRMLRTLGGGVDACLTVTLIDGVVLAARSSTIRSTTARWSLSAARSRSMTSTRRLALWRRSARGCFPGGERRSGHRRRSS